MLSSAQPATPFNFSTIFPWFSEVTFEMLLKRDSEMGEAVAFFTLYTWGYQHPHERKTDKLIEIHNEAEARYVLKQIPLYVKHIAELETLSLHDKLSNAVVILSFLMHLLCDLAYKNILTYKIYQETLSLADIQSEHLDDDTKAAAQNAVTLCSNDLIDILDQWRGLSEDDFQDICDEMITFPLPLIQLLTSKASEEKFDYTQYEKKINFINKIIDTAKIAAFNPDTVATDPNFTVEKIVATLDAEKVRAAQIDFGLAILNHIEALKLSIPFNNPANDFFALDHSEMPMRSNNYYRLFSNKQVDKVDILNLVTKSILALDELNTQLQPKASVTPKI